MSGLLAGAVAATLADVVAFLLLVLPGQAVERNPLIAATDPLAAIAARLSLVVLLVALTVSSRELRARGLRLTVGAALLIAIGVGLTGAASTVVAAS